VKALTCDIDVGVPELHRRHQHGVHHDIEPVLVVEAPSVVEAVQALEEDVAALHARIVLEGPEGKGGQEQGGACTEQSRGRPCDCSVLYSTVEYGLYLRDQKGKVVRKREEPAQRRGTGGRAEQETAL